MDSQAGLYLFLSKMAPAFIFGVLAASADLISSPLFTALVYFIATIITTESVEHKAAGVFIFLLRHFGFCLWKDCVTEHFGVWYMVLILPPILRFIGGTET